jgi:hypothetical protein
MSADIGDLVEVPRPGHSLQLVLATLLELDPCTRDEVLHGL